MSTRYFCPFLLCASISLLVGALGCVETDVIPANDNGGSGSDISTGGSMGPGGMSAGGTAGAAGAGAAPPAGAVFRCEDPGAPKIKAVGDSPLIVDFETGSLGPPSATGEASGNFMFTGGENGGTYTYQETTAQIMRSVNMVEDRNGGQALNVVYTNATDYGGGMGVYFYPCLDASVYQGITLWAQGNLPERMLNGMTIPAGTVTINLDVGNVATNSRDSIGCAMDVPTDATLCARPSTTFVVSDTWAQFMFAWADFAPGNRNGTPYNPNGDNLLGINLAMDNAFGAPHDLQLTIDDVAFVP